MLRIVLPLVPGTERVDPIPPVDVVPVVVADEVVVSVNVYVVVTPAGAPTPASAPGCSDRDADAKRDQTGVRGVIDRRIWVVTHCSPNDRRVIRRHIDHIRIGLLDYHEGSPSICSVSTFICSLDASFPASFALVRMRCTASITSACWARKAFPRS